jgi:hypothetical protein
MTRASDERERCVSMMAREPFAARDEGELERIAAPTLPQLPLLPFRCWACRRN